MANRIQYRRDTAARWESINPVLLEGEVGYELDTKEAKVGDGVHAWNELEYTRNIGSDSITDELGNSEKLVPSQKLFTKYAKILDGRVFINANALMKTNLPIQFVDFMNWIDDNVEVISASFLLSFGTVIRYFSEKGWIFMEYIGTDPDNDFQDELSYQEFYFKTTSNLVYDNETNESLKEQIESLKEQIESLKEQIK